MGSGGNGVTPLFLKPQWIVGAMVFKVFILRQVQNFYPKSLNEGVILDQNSRLVCELIGARFCIRNYLFLSQYMVKRAL